ncbi:MAG: hypothetical protein UY83_C0007G0008 [Candidatus Adlerbacteria bacterium GW2011_GWA1_54_10]|uniref:Uncharacterized protein n=2 Tax=Candidatus Adleribacteriota TaxID=1752736 RepID=A0A0G2ARS5_9BACT|nr:MAG: hypothetical protein UY83_C0007G0008 [Candidatus Adlerbacteria bacterium GW2011_GWA1_54_10]KKW38074.1 MAG: hypothetical protein UY86_C0001G0047 [Candidatus Adlerbacteria bacterium GW2011_GWB1_54_7]
MSIEKEVSIRNNSGTKGHLKFSNLEQGRFMRSLLLCF